MNMMDAAALEDLKAVAAPVLHRRLRTHYNITLTQALYLTRRMQMIRGSSFAAEILFNAKRCRDEMSSSVLPLQ